MDSGGEFTGGLSFSPAISINYAALKKVPTKKNSTLFLELRKGSLACSFLLLFLNTRWTFARKKNKSVALCVV